MAQPPGPLQPLPFPAPILHIGFQGGNQPNWNTVTNALNAIAQEAPLLANVNPAATVDCVNAMIDALNAQNTVVIQALNAIMASLNAMDANHTATLANHTVRLQSIQDNVDLQPMRIRNATASLSTHLVYPPGILVAPPLPLTKRQAINISRNAALQALNTLGVQNIPPGHAAPIALFLNYMGIE